MNFINVQKISNLDMITNRSVSRIFYFFEIQKIIFGIKQLPLKGLSRLNVNIKIDTDSNQYCQFLL